MVFSTCSITRALAWIAVLPVARTNLKNDHRKCSGSEDMSERLPSAESREVSAGCPILRRLDRRLRVSADVISSNSYFLREHSRVDRLCLVSHNQCDLMGPTRLRSSPSSCSKCCQRVFSADSYRLLEDLEEVQTDKVSIEYLLREKLERLVQSEIEARVARMHQVCPLSQICKRGIANKCRGSRIRRTGDAINYGKHLLRRMFEDTEPRR